jgi:beta-galactosidase
MDWTMYRGWYKGERSFGSAPVPWEFCVGEWDAQFLGDRAFQITEKDKRNLRWEAEQWRTKEVWYRWDYPYPPVGASSLGHADKNQVRSMYITDNWRAFRTWGVTAFNEFGYGHFWSLRDGVDTSRQDFAVDWDNIQRPGFSPDYLDRPYETMDMTRERADWVPGGAALALYRNNMPLLAYIGGKPERFTTKDHNFVPGQAFRKQLIVINNSRETVTADCSWSLALPAPQSGRRTVTIETGRQERIPLEFSVPAGARPGTYPLTASVKFSSGETQSDAFDVQVMAPAPAVQTAPRVALFDPKGETTALLRGMGVACDPIDAGADLDGYDVLLVGKEAITLDGPAPGISRVRDGLKVVMFEQTADVLEKRFGFRVQEYGLRRVFERVPDHPLLAGLSTENLHDWQGEATLLAPRLVGYHVRRYSGELLKAWCGIDMTRACRCGNWGSVASVLIEKPARGDFLPIVDGGFSLQYSPLMVYREGKGAMVLCQLDVTGRSEEDPAAAVVVANILNYVSAYSPPPARTVAYAGEDAGRRQLEDSGLAPVPYDGGPLGEDRVLVVGPGAGDALAGQADVVRTWLAGGGRLFAIGLGAAEANKFLPSAIRTSSEEHICTVFDPPGMASLLAGVGPADVHNRGPRDFDLVTSGATIIGDGVLATAGDGKVVFCQMPPWSFDYRKYYDLKRTFRRTSYLVTRVLGNMGCADSTPLIERFSTPVAADEAAPRWTEGFYLDQPQEFDDPYRSFGW